MVDHHVRLATPDDAAAIGQLLHDFNREYDDPTPDPSVLAARVGDLIAAGDTSVVLGGPGHDGVAVLRFRPAVWSPGLECYLAELYVVPQRRGHGLGRAIMQYAIGHARDRGADTMDLGTAEDDTAARGLYASLGFVNCDAPGRAPNLYYELEL
ncbi:MAG: GNAT family N-acetyltransferase [Jatrophihabitantaceae bacterium]